MTQCLCAYNRSRNEIYLAADSYISGDLTLLPSKIFILQRTPKVGMVCSGFLNPWAHVYNNYVDHESVESASEHICNLLSNHDKEGAAYGFLVGFSGGLPRCFYFEAPKGSGPVHCESRPIENEQIQMIGDFGSALSQDRIRVKTLPERLVEFDNDLRKAMNETLIQNTKQRSTLRLPIHSLTLQGGGKGQS